MPTTMESLVAVLLLALSYTFYTEAAVSLKYFFVLDIWGYLSNPFTFSLISLHHFEPIIQTGIQILSVFFSCLCC